jgi:hypothetical protein
MGDCGGEGGRGLGEGAREDVVVFMCEGRLGRRFEIAERAAAGADVGLFKQLRCAFRFLKIKCIGTTSMYYAHSEVFERRTQLQRQIVLVLPIRILRHPENDSRQHDSNVLRDVGRSVIYILLTVVMINDIFEG